MWYLLNPREQHVVRCLDLDYCKRFKKDPKSDLDLVYFVGDRVEWSRTWSAVSGAIPTYRKNPAKYVFRSEMVFLTQAEKLASLGWPVTVECAEAMGTSVFPHLDPKRGDLMVGNSMHLSCAGVVLMLGLTCFGKSEQKPLF